MRRILFLLTTILSSPCTFAQDDIAYEVTALRQLIEEQNRLLNDQSAQLASLAQRVAELEEQTGLVELPAPGVVIGSKDPAPADAPAGRTAAIRTSEIGLEHKKPLRTGIETEIVDKAVVLSESVDLYGSLRVFVEAGADEPTLNDGSSRLGLRLGRAFNDGTSVFGRIEWKVNLVDNDSEQFTSNSSTGGIVVRTEPLDNVLTTRLGYLGGRFDGIGELTFGKQWSVYYDVAGWTDNFNLYGGQGLSVFPAGTDGGFIGSGRADNAVIFRGKRGRFRYGLQTQLKTVDAGDDFTGLGGSLVVSPSESWDIGLAFSGARVEGNFERISGDAESGAATLGVRYHRGPWNTAFAIATWKNHDAVYFVDDTLIYDGVGAELFASYAYSDRLQLYGGLNYADPDIDDPRVDPDFGVESVILGASFLATDASFAFIEALLDNGKDENGIRGDSVISAGYRFDF